MADCAVPFARREPFAYGGALAVAALVGAIGWLVLGRHIDAGHGKRAVWYASATVAAIIVLRALETGSTTAAVVANARWVSGWMSRHTDVDDGRLHPGEAVAPHAEIPKGRGAPLYLSSHTSSKRLLLKTLLTTRLRPFTRGRQQVATRV